MPSINSNFIISCIGASFDQQTASSDDAMGSLAAPDVGFPGDNVLIYPAGSGGDISPIGAIGGVFTGLCAPAGIAVGPAGP
jgi:hypothetical protein